MKKLFLSAVQSFVGLKRFERMLWATSVAVVLVSFLCSRDFDPIVLAASLVGVTALIFIARGDVIGQIFCIVFSIFYAVVSFRFAYYGEMITYLGMSAVIALISTIVWIRNPFAQKQVKIQRLNAVHFVLLLVITVFVTSAFYFVLKFLGTSSLWVSTLSVATSFFAASLTVLRSPYYALGYALNDIVLIALWVIAAMEDTSSIPMILCFVMFLANDISGFINWKRMEKSQKQQ